MTVITRRDWLRAAAGGSVGLALDGLIDLSSVRAATKDVKLANVSEFTTSCNFCSCGCGMIAAVRDGKLITMEGDYDHIVNRGSLCVKGISMFATHASPNRLAAPRYRAPGSDRWEEISWEGAVERIAQKIQKTRDATWIATETLGDTEVPVNEPRQLPSWAARRTPTSVTCSRRRRAFSALLRRTSGSTLTQPHGPRSGGSVWTRSDDQPLD